MALYPTKSVLLNLDRAFLNSEETNLVMNSITCPFCRYFIMLFFIVGCSGDVDYDDIPHDDLITVPPEDELPQINLQTNGSAIVDEPKSIAQMSISEAGIETFNGYIGIEIRGTTSQRFPKKSYGFETRDSDNEDLDVSLLEFPEEEDWILYGPFADKSLMRNMLIYDLSRSMGRYASRTRFVEVSIDSFYRGVYIFMEKLKRDDNRIDINKLKDDENTGEDVTGGYILKIDRGSGTFPSSFRPNYASEGQRINFLYDDPDIDDITDEQMDYISNYMNDFETALASDEFRDTNDGYAAYIDVASFIDFFILTELSNNVDGYRLSTWLTKDKNDKLKMGPIWDFNLAFGNADYCGGGDTNVWAYKFNERCPDDTWVTPFWWDRLLEDPDFTSQLQSRWNSLRQDVLSISSINSQINSYDTLLSQAGAIENNFNKWDVLGLRVAPNNFVGDSHREEVEFLKSWIDDRFNWLDNAIRSL